ncbi:hypothetical protein NP493_607g01054 [Ridgeia piscesae]|uniref:Uncharacterized protein n=1 Tax=Ridgeia piscesae TaxID=27915 RepID=A0AAD9KU23_RIDPI|nr:hypothetical protein NP493_607g01054 [Ridgeia piscesae]
MGLTKQYLRYADAGLFNVIGSSNANVVFIVPKSDTDSKLCAVAACEHVFIWDLRKGEKVATLYGDKHNVVALAASPDKQHLAVGYNDGTIRIFVLKTGQSDVTFSGHKSGITALNYDHNGMRLVSGSKDTDVIVWDIVNEAGLFRLRGNKGVVTQARFLSCRNVLITSCKDTFVKFWDLDTQHCFKTLVGHRTEVGLVSLSL